MPKFNPAVYHGIFLHSLKHRCQRVYGLLLGPNSTQIHHAVPVAHHEFVGTAASTALAMTAEVAKKMSAQNNTTSDPLKVVGVYFLPLDDSVEKGSANILADLSVQALCGPIIKQNGSCLVVKGKMSSSDGVTMEQSLIEKIEAKIKWEVIEEKEYIELLKEDLTDEKYKDANDFETFFVTPMCIPTVL